MLKIVIFFGLTASGKSTLAEAWAKEQEAGYFNTDRVRKEIVGIQATEHRPDAVGKGIYSHELTRETYLTMLDRADELFAKGDKMVVLDGSYAELFERDRVRQLSARWGAEAVFIFCSCSAEETKRRLNQRSQDLMAVSDGRWEIHQYQLKIFAYPLEEEQVIAINTEVELGSLLAQLSRLPRLHH